MQCGIYYLRPLREALATEEKCQELRERSEPQGYGRKAAERTVQEAQMALANFDRYTTR